MGFAWRELSTIAMGFGWPEMMIIALIIVVLFGARRIPEVARGLGEGIRTFKTGLHGDDRKEVEDHKYRDEVDRREESRRSA